MTGRDRKHNDNPSLEPGAETLRSRPKDSPDFNSGNLHLSDVIATIQDEGPARSDPPALTGASEPTKTQAFTPVNTSHTPAKEDAVTDQLPERSQTPLRQSSPEPPSQQPVSGLPEMPRGLIWSLFALLLALVMWNVFSLQHLQDELAKTDTAIEQLRTTRPTNSNEIETVQKNIEELSQRLANLETETVTSQTSTPDFLNELADIKKTVADLTRHIAIADKQSSTAAQSATPDTSADTSWYINVAVLSSNKASQQLKSKILNLGSEATIQPFRSEGKKLYRIRVYGFADQKSAEREAQRLQTALKLDGLWVTR